MADFVDYNGNDILVPINRTQLFYNSINNPRKGSSLVPSSFNQSVLNQYQYIIIKISVGSMYAIGPIIPIFSLSPNVYVYPIIFNAGGFDGREISLNVELTLNPSIRITIESIEWEYSYLQITLYGIK